MVEQPRQQFEHAQGIEVSNQQERERHCNPVYQHDHTAILEHPGNHKSVTPTRELRSQEMDEQIGTEIKTESTGTANGSMHVTAGNSSLQTPQPPPESAPVSGVGAGARRRRRAASIEPVARRYSKRRKLGAQTVPTEPATPPVPALAATPELHQTSETPPAEFGQARSNLGAVDATDAEEKGLHSKRVEEWQPQAEAGVQLELTNSMVQSSGIAVAERGAQKSSCRNVTLPARRIRTTVTRSKPSKRAASVSRPREQAGAKLLGTSLTASKLAEDGSLVQKEVARFVQEQQASPLVLSRGTKAQAPHPKASLPATIPAPEQLTFKNWYMPFQKLMVPPLGTAGILSHPVVHPLPAGDGYIGPHGIMALGMAPPLGPPGILTQTGVSLPDSYVSKPFLRASDSSQHINELIAKYSHSPLEQDLWSPRWSAKPAPWMEDPGPCQLSRCQDVLEFMGDSDEEGGEVNKATTEARAAEQPNSNPGEGRPLPGHAWSEMGAGLGKAWASLGKGSGAPRGPRGQGMDKIAVGNAVELTPGITACMDGGGNCDVWPGMGADCDGSAGGKSTRREVPSGEGGNTRVERGQRLESLLDMADLDVGEVQISDWLLDTPGSEDWAAEDWLTDGEFLADSGDKTPTGVKTLTRVETNESSTGGGQRGREGSRAGEGSGHNSEMEVEGRKPEQGLGEEVAEGMGEGGLEDRVEHEVDCASADHSFASWRELPEASWWKGEDLTDGAAGMLGSGPAEDFGLPGWGGGEDALRLA